MMLTYTKYILISAFFVFCFGAGITMEELVSFLVRDARTTAHLSAVLVSALVLISLIGLYGALREDACILVTYGSLILTVFVAHVILLFFLKHLCSETQRKCYRNMATPPGLAPVLVAISELAIGMCAFFMALVIESGESAAAGRRRAAAAGASGGKAAVAQGRRTSESQRGTRVPTRRVSQTATAAAAKAHGIPLPISLTSHQTQVLSLADVQDAGRKASLAYPPIEKETA